MVVTVSILAYFFDNADPSTSRNRIIYCEKDIIRFYKKYPKTHKDSEGQITEAQQRLNFLKANAVDAFLEQYPSKDRKCYYE